MSCKIFVSTSGTENDDWTKWLRKTIVDRCSISLGQVYWYGSSGYGVDIGKEIQQKIEESVILLCLVSDSYLVSPWCLKEHEWFCQGATSAQIPLTVLSPLVSGWPDTKSTDQTRAFFRGKLEKLKSAIHEGFGGEFIRLCTYAEEKWFPWLQEARHSDLRSTSAATLGGVKGPFRQTTDLKRLVEQLNACLLQAKKCPPGMPAGPERKSLRAVANLAAFALAADRYCDGGWGFSSADDLSYDEYG